MYLGVPSLHTPYAERLLAWQATSLDILVPKESAAGHRLVPVRPVSIRHMIRRGLHTYAPRASDDWPRMVR